MANQPVNQLTPSRAVTVTPSDSASNVYSMLHVGGAGTVKITDREGNDTTWTVAASGYVYCQTSKVWSTGTTATSIIGLA